MCVHTWHGTPAPNEGTLPGPSPLLPADVNTHGGRGCQDVSDQGQKSLQDQLQGGAARLDIAAETDGWMEPQTHKQQVHKNREAEKGSEAARACFHSGLWNLEGTARLHSHLMCHPGSLSCGPCPSLFAPSPLCYKASGVSPHVPLILALQKLLDLRQDGGAQVQFPQGAGERPGNRCPQHPAPPTVPAPPTAATYAFWLTMLRRSTTTDRSLMATAESTDVCANRAPVSEDRGHSGPAWV